MNLNKCMFNIWVWVPLSFLPVSPWAWGIVQVFGQETEMWHREDQETGAVWESKNRKQEEAAIAWLLWCLLEAQMVLLLSVDPWTTEGLIKANRVWSRLWCMSWCSLFVEQHNCLKWPLIFWCLSEHFHKSVFVTGVHLGLGQMSWD